MSNRISARIVSSAALGVAFLAMGSCARETPGYCAFAEGDSTCDATYPGTFCIFQGPGFLEYAGVEYRNVSEAQRLGCYESRPVTPGGEDMGMEFYACVPNGVGDGDGRLRDLQALNKGKKDGKSYDLVAFLSDHGITPEVHASGCRPGSGMTTTDTSESGSTTSGTESSTTDTGSSGSSTTGAMLCMGNEDCPRLEAPQCIDGECRPCVEGADGDAACARVDPSHPVCPGGVCVQCTLAAPEACMDMTPVCDDTTNTCVPCAAHDQCSSGACELKVGRCFPSDAVRLEVDGDGPADYTSISLAANAVDGGAYGVIVVRELDGGADYGPAVINAGKTIALLAAPGEEPIIQGAVGNPGLRVSDEGTTLYMDGLSVSNNPTGRGLLVETDACAWVDRSRIVLNTSGGILVQNNAELILRNSFAGGFVDAIGVEVNGSSVAVLYSTIATTTLENIPALSCTMPVAVDIRNSIIVSQGGESPDELSCMEASIADSVTEVEAMGFNTGWFASFNTGDYHLTESGAATFVDKASWISGDPTTDIDGDPRPQGMGTRDYAGADVPSM